MALLPRLAHAVADAAEEVAGGVAYGFGGVAHAVTDFGGGAADRFGGRSGIFADALTGFTGVRHIIVAGLALDNAGVGCRRCMRRLRVDRAAVAQCLRLHLTLILGLARLFEVIGIGKRGDGRHGQSGREDQREGCLLAVAVHQVAHVSLRFALGLGVSMTLN